MRVDAKKKEFNPEIGIDIEYGWNSKTRYMEYPAIKTGIKQPPLAVLRRLAVDYE